jgi:hypothetical protein
MRIQPIVTGALLILLAGCVTPTVTQRPALDIDFARFKTVAYKVHVTPTTEYGSDMKYANDTISLVDTLLGRKITELGYVLPAADARPDLAIDVAISAVKQGSAAARVLVGFGAGRAVLMFDASFEDSRGSRLASFQGGRSYTGMEFGQGFAGNDQIQTLAATRAVSQIEEFMRNGGTFHNQDARKPGTKAVTATYGPIVSQASDPTPITSAGPQKSVDQQLTELKRLHDSGLITDDVYADRQKVVLARP